MSEQAPTEQPGRPEGDRPADLAPDAPTEVVPAGAEPASPPEPVTPPPPTPGATVDEPAPVPPPESPAEPVPPAAVAPPPPAAGTPPPPAGGTPPPPGAGTPPPASPAFGTTSPGDQPYESPSAPKRDWADTVLSVFPEDHPELAVGAAFTGGLVLALILKRLAR